MQERSLNDQNIGICLLLISFILLLLFEIGIINLSRLGIFDNKTGVDPVTKSYPIYRILLFVLPFLFSFSILLISNLFRELFSSIKILGNWKWPLILLVFNLFIVFIGKDIIGPMWENFYLVILLIFSFYTSYFIYGKKELKFKFLVWFFSNPFILLVIIGIASDLILKIISR